jgi:hypothetical protein
MPFVTEVTISPWRVNLDYIIPGPRLDWDPDVVAALDDDFDFEDPENELDDDFVMAANVEVDENAEKGQRYDCFFDTFLWKKIGAPTSW